MATRHERRRATQKEEQGRIWGAFAAIAMSVLPSMLPRLPIAIVAALSALWLASWPMARNGYKYRLATKWVVVLMLVHGSVFVAMGYWMWPRITVSPTHVSFQGYENETFNFSVRNGRGDDVYDVQIPFLIGYNKHLQDKVTAKVTAAGEPSSRVLNDYNYCFGMKGDGVISHVQPNEREVLIVHVPHLVPYGTGSFTVTYTGGEKFETQPGTPDFIDAPYSYSPNQATVGVRGDYRICKFAMRDKSVMP